MNEQELEKLKQAENLTILHKEARIFERSLENLNTRVIITIDYANMGGTNIGHQACNRFDLSDKFVKDVFLDAIDKIAEYYHKCFEEA